LKGEGEGGSSGGKSVLRKTRKNVERLLRLRGYLCGGAAWKKRKLDSHKPSEFDAETFSQHARQGKKGGATHSRMSPVRENGDDLLRRGVLGK